MSNTRQVKLIRDDSSQSWGFRLQGGKDFHRPISIQAVAPGGVAEQCGLLAGDFIVAINGTNMEDALHETAKMEIFRSGNDILFTVTSGAADVWQPAVQDAPPPPGTTFAPQQQQQPQPPRHSLASTQQAPGRVGAGHNRQARGFAAPQQQRPQRPPPQMRPTAPMGGMPPPPQDGMVPAVVYHAQYNSPAGLYSSGNIADVFQQTTDSLTGGAGGDMTGGLAGQGAAPQFESPTMKALREQGGAQAAGEPQSRSFKALQDQLDQGVPPSAGPHGMRPVRAPQANPNAPRQQAPPQSMVCWGCQTEITGMFVRVKNNPMHPDCFQCSTCGTSLRQQGYYLGDNQLFCREHAGELARPSQPTNAMRQQ